MGKEHDFSECQTADKWENGGIIKKKTCPFDNMVVSLIQPQIKCKVEEKIKEKPNYMAEMLKKYGEEQQDNDTG